MKKIILPILLLIILQLSCKENSVTPPPDNNPPGWQEDIPWPSLANSPWPTNHADPQNTGRSKSNGPSLGNVSWVFNDIYADAGIVIGADSTIYFSSSLFDSNGKLYAVNFDGTIK